MKDLNIWYERFGTKVVDFQQLDREIVGYNRIFFQKKAVSLAPNLKV
jgi:hypothetical protein